MVWTGRTVRVLEFEELVAVHTLVAGAVSVSFFSLHSAESFGHARSVEVEAH
jgi:hypothetical protein